MDSPPEAPIIEVDKDIHSKSQSQRIRDCLYILWQQSGKPDIFDTYYKKKTERYIEFLKNKMED